MRPNKVQARPAIGCLVLIAFVGLSACGGPSNDSRGATTDPVPLPTETPTPTGPDSGSSGSESPVDGRLVVTEGQSVASLTLTARFIPAGTGETPPPDVMSACNWNSAVANLDDSSWAEGQVTVSYQGAVDQEILVDTGSGNSLFDVTHSGYGAAGGYPIAIIGPDGSINCPVTGTIWEPMVSPGESVTAQYYSLLPSGSENLMNFQSGGERNLLWVSWPMIGGKAFQSTPSATGHSAAQCAVTNGGDGDKGLLLFGHVPMKFETEARGSMPSQSGTCIAPD